MKTSNQKLIREIVIERLKHLNAGSNRNNTATTIVELDQERIGRLSRLDAIQNQEIAKALAVRKEIEKDALLHCLSRMKNDQYGECIDCGENIEFERLKINPTVLKCSYCMQNRN